MIEALVASEYQNETNILKVFVKEFARLLPRLLAP